MPYYQTVTGKGLQNFVKWLLFLREINVSNITKYYEQPKYLESLQTDTSLPIPGCDGGEEFEVQAILGHRSKDRTFEWLTGIKGAPQHKVEWEPTEDFINNDGIITGKLHGYIVDHGLLKHLHWWLSRTPNVEGWSIMQRGILLKSYLSLQATGNTVTKCKSKMWDRSSKC